MSPLVAFKFQFFIKKHKGQEIKMGVLYVFLHVLPRDLLHV